MTNELKQQFTLRITGANSTELIVILYDMMLSYVEEAKEAHEREDKIGFREALRKIKNCNRELIASLHMEYELAVDLLSLYIFVNKELIKANVYYDESALNYVSSVIGKLREAYIEIAKQNDEAPLMQNTQTILAGYTYGREDITETIPMENRRGIYA